MLKKALWEAGKDNKKQIQRHCSSVEDMQVYGMHADFMRQYLGKYYAIFYMMD